MNRDRYRQRRFDTLENAVIQNDTMRVNDLLRGSGYYDNTGRALGLALRYCGCRMVKVLLRHGATLENTLDWDQMIYRRRQAGPDDDYLELIFPQFWHPGEEEPKSVLSPRERLKCIDLLIEKDACDTSKLLYYAILFGDTAVVELCDRRGVQFTSVYKALFRGEPPASESRLHGRIVATRSIFETWTDERIKQAISRLNRYSGIARFPVIHYDLVSLERICSENLFEFAVHNTDLDLRTMAWDVALTLMKAHNAHGLSYMLDHDLLPNPMDQSYLLELARGEKNVPSQVISVLVKKLGQSQSSEEDLGLQIQSDIIDERTARNSWTYTIKEAGSTCEIEGYNGASSDVVVPTKIAEMKVTGISEHAFDPLAKGITPAVAASRIRIRWVQFPGSIEDVPANSFNIHGYRGRDSTDSTFAGRERLVRDEQPQLEEVVLSEGIRTISQGAFEGCSRLSSVLLPRSLEIIREKAFEECTILSLLEWPDSLTCIGDAAFKHTGLRELSLPHSVKVLGERAFESCDQLSSVTIPGSLHTIASRAFACCTNLERVHIEDGVKVIEASAFSGCSKLNQIRIPDSVEKIETDAFADCPQLQIVR